jgi:hypothetical protein
MSLVVRVALDAVAVIVVPLLMIVVAGVPRGAPDPATLPVSEAAPGPIVVLDSCRASPGTAHRPPLF